VVTGEVFADRYQVLTTVSRTANASVLRAIDRRHDRPVALKVHECTDAAQREALLAEARVLLGLEPHPGLPTVRDDFFVDARYVVVMDWVEGTDLGRLLAERGEPGLPRSVVVDCVSQVAAGLDHLHHHDPPVVHGDVKPANVIRSAAGRITLVDFGIASAGRARRRAGTRGYIAPEVAADGQLTPAADVYGLAATAVALLTGRPPGGTAPQWEGIDPAEVGPLARALRRALATDPARRPRSAGELAERLRAGRFDSLPSGVVTFMAIDVADAAALWDARSDVMATAVDRLDDVVADVVDRHGGRLVGSGGRDAWLAVFAEASAAAHAASTAHQRVAMERWPGTLPLRVRVVLHSGEAELRDGDYHGRTVHLAGRLLTVVPAGRTVVSQTTADLLADRLPAGAALIALDAPAAAAGNATGGRLFGLVDREADRFVFGTVQSGERAADVVWLLCTDVEGSTQLLQRSPERYRSAMDRYRRVLAETCTEFGGTLLSSVEDTAALALPGPREALAAALAAQRSFESAPRGVASGRVRIGIDVEQSTDAALPVSTATAQAVCRAGHGGQVLMTEAARALAATELAAGADLLDLGLHRLSDLAQPHRLYQLKHPELAADFPPLRSLDNRPHNLPVLLTRFIGRRDEIARLIELLDANRLCTITGTGGAGKTRLALQVATEELVSFPDGVWLVDLAGVPDGEMVASTVAIEVGVREGGSGTYAAPRGRATRSTAERLVDHLEFRRALIVLDNCEHVIDACAQLVDVLLRRCRRVQILATSREILGLAAEQTFRLGPLELPPPAAAPATVRQCASVQLFSDRAMLRRPDLTFGDDELAAIASICQRVDGIPFAIELAAARVNVLAVTEIAATLGENLGVLSGGSRTVTARQPTLQAMIEWSDSLLSDQERKLLRRLSVFAGGFSLDAATHVCAGDGIASSDVLDLLAALVDKSLLETEPAASRFRLLEVTRQYASERLVQAGEDAAVRAAHLAWYRTLADRADEALTGADQARWLDLLDADHENLLVALASGREGADGDDARLATALSQFWLIRGQLTEGRAWLEAAVARYLPPDSLRVKTLWSLGHLACFAGDYDRARDVADEARQLARRLDSRRWEARADMLLGLAASGSARPMEAEQRHRAAAEGARTAGDQWCYACALNNLGNVLALEGASTAARESYEESLALRRHDGDTWGMSWVLFRLGLLASWESRYGEATALLEEALQRSTTIRFGQGILLAQLGLGENLYLSGDDRGAARRYADALHTARALDENTGAGVALAGLARVALGAGDVNSAARWLDEPEADVAGDPERALATRAALLGARAAVATASGENQRAESLHLEALRLRHSLGDKRATCEELEAVAIAALGQGGDSRAATLLATAAQWRTEIGFPIPTRQSADVDDAIQVLSTGDAAWPSGRALGLDDAVTLALDAVTDPR
jgi:predicted ATPase/class 3 adenylate cyclase